MALEGNRDDANSPFSVGRFVARPDTNTLHDGDETIRLEPLVFDVLATLARNAPKTVTREELLEKHWPEHVTEDALNRVVWKLRKALEGCHDGEVIETVPKKGYRLAAPVSCEVKDEPRVAAARRGRSLLIAAGLLVAVFILFRLSLPGSGTTSESKQSVAAHDTLRPLTSLVGYESSPSFSPDGSKIVFHHYAKTGARKGQLDIHIVDVRTGENRALTESLESELSPVFSPDGTAVAFARVGDLLCEIMSLELASGSVRRLAPCGPAGTPSARCCPELAWSPDGKSLTFSDHRAMTGPGRLFSIAPDSDEARIVTDPPAQSEGDRSPRFSPDGTTLAFVRGQTPGVDDIWVHSLGDGNERRLTMERQPIAGLAFTEDGRELVFSSRRTGTFRLYRIALEGGPVISVETIGINATSPALWQEALVYEEWRSEINIWSVPILDDDKDAEPLIRSSLWDWNPAYSPSGDRIAFLSNRSGPTEVWLVSSDGTGARQISELEASFASPIRWSPDGARITLSAPIEGNSDVVLIDVNTRAVERLTTDASDERDPIWSANGNAIYFTSNRTSRDEIFVFDLDTRAVSQITSNSGHQPIPSADGTRLYFTRPGASDIFVRELSSATESLVVSRPSVRDAPWGHIGDTLLWIEADANQRYSLWQQSSDGEKTLLRHLEGPDSAINEIFAESTFSIAPDGRSLLVGCVDRSDSDLWMSH